MHLNAAIENIHGEIFLELLKHGTKLENFNKHILTLSLHYPTVWNHGVIVENANNKVLLFQYSGFKCPRGGFPKVTYR